MKHYQKEFEYSDAICSSPDSSYQSPVRTTQRAMNEEILDEVPIIEERPQVHNSCLEEQKEKSECGSSERSPLPRQVFENVSKKEGTVCNIYNFSPHAVEKRKNVSKREEMEDFHSSGLLPRLLEMNKKSESFSDIPLLLNKSLLEGCDPFESVKRSLSNGTLQRDKIFSKIKVNENIRIGGKEGSIFNPFVRSSKPSHRTASSSLDSKINEEAESTTIMIATPALKSSNSEISQNLNMPQKSLESDENYIDQNLLDYLDNYSTEVLQKTALMLLGKSFQMPRASLKSMNVAKHSNYSERESTNNEVMSEGSSEFKPCNCRKSKCLKLYCECFSNGRKCTSKCDCSPCCNTHAHEDMILKSKEQILGRNPDAFKPKFTEEETKKIKAVKHQRGCNCQKSGCLKKYCECYQMGVECSDLCRCLGCHNCGPKGGKKESQLGKRKRTDPLAEVADNHSDNELLVSLQTMTDTYTSKPRRAKENRFMHFNDDNIELL